MANFTRTFSDINLNFKSHPSTADLVPVFYSVYGRIFGVTLEAPDEASLLSDAALPISGSQTV